MTDVTASASFNAHKLTDLPVINPGDWFGKTWLLEIGGSYWPVFVIVEADSVQDAIDELADNQEYGHLITAADEDLADYPQDERQFGPSGQVLDLDHLQIHGQEGVDFPFLCTYHGGDLPQEGMKPTDYYCREDDE